MGPNVFWSCQRSPPDDLSCLTTAGVGRPGDGAVARAVERGGGSSCVRGGSSRLSVVVDACLVGPMMSVCGGPNEWCVGGLRWQQKEGPWKQPQGIRDPPRHTGGGRRGSPAGPTDAPSHTAPSLPGGPYRLKRRNPPPPPPLRWSALDTTCNTGTGPQVSATPPQAPHPRVPGQLPYRTTSAGGGGGQAPRRRGEGVWTGGARGRPVHRGQSKHQR